MIRSWKTCLFPYFWYICVTDRAKQLGSMTGIGYKSMPPSAPGVPLIRWVYSQKLGNVCFEELAIDRSETNQLLNNSEIFPCKTKANALNVLLVKRFLLPSRDLSLSLLKI